MGSLLDALPILVYLSHQGLHVCILDSECRRLAEGVPPRRWNSLLPILFAIVKADNLCYLHIFLDVILVKMVFFRWRCWQTDAILFRISNEALLFALGEGVV